MALASYAIPLNGQLLTVSPHDLRCTYARHFYLVDTDLVAIQQNLGHDRQKTTLDYIGTLDAKQCIWEQLARHEVASQSFGR